jgi:hypothetical protein
MTVTSQGDFSFTPGEPAGRISVVSAPTTWAGWTRVVVAGRVAVV